MVRVAAVALVAALGTALAVVTAGPASAAPGDCGETLASYQTAGLAAMYTGQDRTGPYGTITLILLNDRATIRNAVPATNVTEQPVTPSGRRFANLATFETVSDERDNQGNGLPYELRSPSCDADGQVTSFTLNSETRGGSGPSARMNRVAD